MNESPETILVLATSARDSDIACEELARGGMVATSIENVDQLCLAIRQGAGAALVTEDHLSRSNLHLLQHVLTGQPPWSDFPLLVLASKTTRPLLGKVEFLGNVTVLQPPLRIRTLLSAARTALRSRRRQYNARRAIDERDRFLAMLGHELRNPLAGIAFALETCDNSGRVPPASLAVIQRQTAQLSRLVNDLFEVSRVSTGKIELHRSWENLSRLVESSTANARPRFEAAGIEFVVTVEPELMADVDLNRFEQVIGNLLNNAAKYTPPGGRVMVRFASVGQDQAQLEIEDSGEGIAPHMLEAIFQQFVQLDTTLARSQGGMGIGLTLVRTLVELHGGTVHAESDGPGQGSKFVVRVPLSEQPASSEPGGGQPRQAEPDRPHVSRRIVLVEDNEDSRELLLILLQDLGHEVAVAADGRAGLALVEDFQPDAALIDIGLPEIDGYELARRLRRDVGRNLHLVAISGYGQPEDRRRALEAGFNEHLTKPPPLQRLQQILDELPDAWH